MQRPFNSIHISPLQINAPVPFDDDLVVESPDNAVIIPARILKATEQGEWLFE